MRRRRLISRFALLAAAVAAVAAVAAGSVGAKGVVFGSFPSANVNGWYNQDVTGSFAFDVDGLGGYFSLTDGSYDERLSSLTCSGGPGFSYTPPPSGFLPFIPGNPSIPVQQGVTVSGETDYSGTGVGCTAGYERKTYNDCHAGFLSGGRYCLDISDWTDAGTSSDNRTIRIDETPPYNVVVHATSSPNANGWYNSPVTFTVSGQDDLSGIWNCGLGFFPWLSASKTVNTDTSFDSSQVGCRDNAANATSSGVSWKYDSHKPTLAPSISPSGVLLRGSSATASPHAVDVGPSGIPVGGASCDPVDTSTVGSFSVNCSATDRAGNTQTATVNYTVGFDFTGFFAPVDNPDVVNTAKAGQAIPLKFHVADANGPVTDLSSYTLSSTGETCDSGDPTDALENYAAGASGLQNLGGGDYQINWKTDKSYAGQCRQLNLTLGDATVHSADFKFVK